MSDDPQPDLEVLNAARKEIGDAIGHYADGWNTTEGGIVTGFIVIAEVASPDGDRRLLEVVGYGPDGSEGMPHWHRAGMLHEALHERQE